MADAAISIQTTPLPAGTTVLKLTEDPDFLRLVQKVDRIERALFGGWDDSGQRSDGFIALLNAKLEGVDNKAAQALEVALQSQTTFRAMLRGIWAVFLAVLASAVPTLLSYIHHAVR